MAFYFRVRYRLPHSVRNKGEAQHIVDAIRLQRPLDEFYDGTTIEIIEEKKGWIADALEQLLGHYK